MKAIILAAGRGSRLGNLTKERPKCLNLVGDFPLIEWQITALKNGGVKDITLVTGYQATLLESYGLKTIFNERWESTNMVQSLLCSAEEFSEPVIISYSDILYQDTVVAQLCEQKKEAVVTYDVEWFSLWERRFENPLEDAESFQIEATGRIKDIGRRVTSCQEIEGQYIGLLRFTPKAFQAIQDFTASVDRTILDQMDMTTLLQGLIHQQFPIYGMSIQGGWCEIDTVRDLEIANQLFSKKNLSQNEKSLSITG